MGNILLYTAIVFFISFGIISFINFITDFVYETKYLKDKTVCTVVGIKDDEGTVENIVRAVLFKEEKSWSGVCRRKVVFVSESEDKTAYKILKRLEKSDGKITVSKKADLLKNLDFL